MPPDSGSAQVDAGIVQPDAGPTSVCGDGACGPGENPQNCAADCKGNTWTCGDGVCDIGEQFYCQKDCTVTTCGNGTCDNGETTLTCAKDCPTSGWNCGDGKCDPGEQFYCQKDCTTTPPTDVPACLQGACATEYGKCSASSSCLQGLTCLSACAGSWSCQQKCVQGAGQGGSTLVQLAMCGQKAGCLN